MGVEIVVSGHPKDTGLHVRTPGTNAMDVAIGILEFLDQKPEVSVQNTGWKDGFGLEVAAWIPVRTLNVDAELMTDGDELQFRRVSGPSDEFEVMFESISDLLAGGN